jgi:hypothetical protein
VRGHCAPRRARRGGSPSRPYPPREVVAEDEPGCAAGMRAAGLLPRLPLDRMPVPRRALPSGVEVDRVVLVEAQVRLDSAGRFGGRQCPSASTRSVGRPDPRPRCSAPSTPRRRSSSRQAARD